MSKNRNQTATENTDHGVFGDFSNAGQSAFGEYGRLVDLKEEVAVTEHSRPHWSQAGAITFITFRTKDSIPREVVQRWDTQRLAFIRQKGIVCKEWRVGRELLAPSDLQQFEKDFGRLREDELDSCHGTCLLRNPVAAEIVAEALYYFDDDRYLLGDFVVMPNHLHLLAAFPSERAMRRQCYSWMKFTAAKINAIYNRSGQFWQPEAFENLVRSEKQLTYLRKYIAENPFKSNLPDGDFYYRKSHRKF